MGLMELENVKIYRMTHIENVPHVLKYGITHKDSKNANSGFKSIGDVSLINNRSSKNVTVDNGNVLRMDSPTIILGNFIPFYFGVRMPLLYVIQNGGNFVQEATNAMDIIYLVCSVNSILKSGAIFYFSDGHSTDRFTTFYDKTKIEELPSLIDWNAVTAPYWSGSDHLDIKRKKQAEFLVSGDISVDHIIGFGCYNEHAKATLMEIKIDEKKIKVIPNAYF